MKTFGSCLERQRFSHHLQRVLFCFIFIETKNIPVKYGFTVIMSLLEEWISTYNFLDNRKLVLLRVSFH